MKLTKASCELSIKYSTAKAIISTYRKQGRIGKK